MTPLLWADKVKTETKAKTPKPRPRRMKYVRRARDQRGRTFPWAKKTQKTTTRWDSKNDGSILCCEMCGVPTNSLERVWVNAFYIPDGKLKKAGVDWKPTHFMVCVERCSKRLVKMGGLIDEDTED